MLSNRNGIRFLYHLRQIQTQSLLIHLNNYSSLLNNEITKFNLTPIQTNSTSYLIHRKYVQANNIVNANADGNGKSDISKPPMSEIEMRQANIEKQRKERELARYTQFLKEQTEQQESLVLKKSPKRFKSYLQLMRLDKTAPIYLTFWPGAWAILGAASYQIPHATPDFYLLGLFALGAVTMRSAGCIVNDIWDRDVDRKVERTKDRPLASGSVSIPEAFALLGVNLSASLAILWQLNLTTQVLGACCLLPVAIYPAAKRFTNWPQAMLGVTFNWGALMGWSAVLCSSGATQSQSLLTFLPALFLYAGCVNWTLFYDTIYAFQDKEHDAKLGLKSSAIYLENKKPKLWLLGFASLCASNLSLFGWLTNQEPIFYMSVGVCMLQFLKQIAMVDLKSPESCHRQFKSNTTVGALVGFGLLASLLIK